MKILVLFSIFGLTCSTSAVSITKCKAADSACLKQSAQAFVPILAAGIPEFGSKPLDPLHIPTINASVTTLKLHANDLVVTGMKDCTIPEISRDLAKHTLYVDVLCHSDVQAKYDLHGKLLTLPIDGTGHLSIQLQKILISVHSKMEDVVRDGKKYWNIKSWDYTWELKDRTSIELKDMFGGSPELTKALRELLADSSTEIIKEFGAPIVKSIVSEVVAATKLLYSHVPADELALD